MSNHNVCDAIRPGRRRMRSASLLLALALAACGDGHSPGWQLATDKNPITDVTNIYLTVDSSSGKEGPLTVRCQDNATAVLISISEKISGEDAYNESVSVTARFDDQKPLSPVQWNTLKGKDGVALSGDGAREFIRAMERSKTLAIAMEGETSTITAVFDVEGLREAMRPFSNFCGWKQLSGG